ncbi:SMP-30/gluconolactonase/LRE family protein [Hymenobacter armeniacus]|uniref:SMP-30/gluconolactonase/LRE family protein n=1 Tax=Hymenobacter armeniacus TaxID=2771358 RepID=A0ABR8JW49_9BACT|nr:SMP-30/gluconolactonase/LRE family protein [Hymenobacter armeniacus]MBD2724189.1 SMP-30/gluconolactonase/LRE family protein [Hymenobacter armeniacus]
MSRSAFSGRRRPVRLPRFVVLAALAAGLLGTLPGCSKDEDITTPTVTNPDRISVPQAALHPEGVQYDDANKRFIVSSRTKGVISTVKDDSTFAQLADDSRLISTIGVNLDAGRNRVLVAVSDNGVNPARTTAATLRKRAALAIFNNTSGALLNYVDLGGLPAAATYPNHFANDIAVDKDGNAYVTDSNAPIIYKVDPQGVASVFLTSPQFDAGTAFGLNGIVYHPDGYLIVAKANTGTLYKVPIATPASFTAVTNAAGLSLTGADGLLLTDPQTLLLVSGSQSTVYRLSSTDAWANVRSTGTFATGAVSPTTITKRGSDAYVLYPYTATSPRFKIVKVRF